MEGTTFIPENSSLHSSHNVLGVMKGDSWNSTQRDTLSDFLRRALKLLVDSLITSKRSDIKSHIGMLFSLTAFMAYPWAIGMSIQLLPVALVRSNIDGTLPEPLPDYLDSFKDSTRRIV